MGQSFGFYLMLNESITEEIVGKVFEYFSERDYFEQVFDIKNKKLSKIPLNNERIKEFMKSGTKRSVDFAKDFSVSMLYSDKVLSFFSSDAVLSRDWEPTPQRAELWKEIRDLIVGLVNYLGPVADIAFSDLENSTVNVHLRFKKSPPPDDELSFLCSAVWLLFISKRRIQKIGKEFLIKTPAWKVDETEYGIFIINGPSPLVYFPDVPPTNGSVDDYFASYLKKVKYPGKWYDSRGIKHSSDGV